MEELNTEKLIQLIDALAEELIRCHNEPDVYEKHPPLATWKMLKNG